MEGIESLSKSKVRVLRGAEKAVAAIQGQRYNFKCQTIFFSVTFLKFHLFCKQCLHKDLVFINWELMSALASLEMFGEEDLAGTYLQTPLPLPEFFPIGQWNRFKKREIRHLTDPLALELVCNGTKVSLTGSLMGL